MRKNRIAILALLAFCLLISAISVAAQDTKTITVNGTGTVNLDPDIVHVTVGVSTTDRDISTSVNKNTEIVGAITDALLGAGIAQEDLNTLNYSMYSSQVYDSETDSFLEGVYNYYVDYSYRVTVRDISTLNEILNLCIDNGANGINGIEFDSSQRNEAVDLAREYAIENAADKAENIAEKIGVELSGIISVDARDSQSLTGTINRSQVNDYMAMGGSGTAPVSGTLSVSADVSIVYAYN